MSIPFPVELAFGDLRLSAHAILEVLAFFSGYRYYQHLRSKTVDAIEGHNREWIFIGAAAGAFIGSRLLGALESPSVLLNSKQPLLHLFASKTIVGGLLGGLAGVELMKKRIGVNRRSGDLFTYPLVLGICIGRLGCFLNGIHEPTFGLATEWITGMDLGDGLKRHPIALYEIVFLVLLWIALRSMESWTSAREGIRFRIFMIAYLAFRFLVQFIKPRAPVVAGLDMIQIACLAGLVYYRHTIITLIFKRTESAPYA